MTACHFKLMESDEEEKWKLGYLWTKLPNGMDLSAALLRSDEAWKEHSKKKSKTTLIAKAIELLRMAEEVSE